MWMFEAMNTQVTVCAPELDDDAERRFAQQAATRFAAVVRRFSRFLPDSELSQLNRATSSVTVSAEMIDLLRDCREHVANTNGLFDPAIGGALAAAGYDRSFVPGALDRAQVPAPSPLARFSDLLFDEDARIVVRPRALQLDFGGFLKGRTVDRVIATAPAAVLVDAGGDIAARGDGPDGSGWLIDIEDPTNPERVVATLRVRDRSIATSAPNRRHWRAGSKHVHHLIDPRTGLPSSSDLAQVTVVAPTTEQADVYAKATFLLGARGGRAFIADRAASGIAAVLIGRDGALEVVGDLEVVDA
jgi:thiamine biosynthesis lipoprotein